jgi:hypothetical protein
MSNFSSTNECNKDLPVELWSEEINIFTKKFIKLAEKFIIGCKKVDIV